MSSLASPRGPLPPRVYWVRRGVALGAVLLALLLLVGLVRMIFGGSDAPASTGTAQQAAAQPTSEAKPRTKPRTAGADAGRPSEPTAEPTPMVTPTEPVQAQPNGRCTPSDIELSPVVANAQTYLPVTVTLQAKTRKAAACTWRFSPATAVVKVVRDKATLWSSAACRAWIAPRDVVLRAEEVTPLTVTWNARRSDTGCSEQYSAFATVGTYQVVAAALGGDSSTTEFGLRAASTPSTPQTPASQPTARPTNKPTNQPANKPSGRSSENARGAAPGSRESTPVRETYDPQAKPSGAVERD